MHTLVKVINGIEYRVHHNGDWSGDATVVYTDRAGGTVEVTMPGELLKACGRDRAFRDVIGAIELME